jgi:serine/threonine protein kinase
VLHQIGAGALGPVFRAYEPERDRLVAVKVFRLDLPPERVHQLVGEFERLIEAALRHSAITAPVAAGLDGVVAYLAQEYFSGDSLDILIRENGSLSPVEALRVAGQLAEGLDFAAERGVEHGALNPRDVLLSPEGACIAGLGITRALEHIGAATPIRRPYTSPERMEGGAWDRRADVFSLAAIVHEMMWGRRVVGTGMEAVEGLTPIPGTHLAALQAVFARALAEQAVDRFATATEFIESLEGVVSAETPAPEDHEWRAETRPEEPGHVVPTTELLLPLEDEPAPLELDLRDHAALPPDLEAIISAQAPPEPEPEPAPVAAAGREPLAREEPLEPLVPLEPLEPLTPLAPLETREPLEPRKSVVSPSFLMSTPSFSATTGASSSSSFAWPIGLACLVGLAIGFGVGYTVAVRDRGNPSPTTAPAPATPAGRAFTETAVGSGSTEPKAANDLRLTPETRASTPAPDASAAAPDAPAPAVPFNGRILVRSVPAGARVLVDGRDRGSTPASVSDLGSGEHRLRVVHDGYTTAERRVVLSPARPTQALTVPLAKAPVSPRPAPASSANADPVSPKQSVKPSAEAGTLLVESRPTGATVFVDGRNVGRTPLTLPDVSAGDHAVRLELSGHRPWSTSVKVEGGAPQRVGGSLEKTD